MARTLMKAKGRADVGQVTVVPKAILLSPEYAALTAHEVKLLLDIVVQFNGYTNNGDLQCTWRLMKVRGWRSQATLWRALHGLLDKNFVVKTRQGGKHRCSLYGVTWVEIHECKGKPDMRPTRAMMGAWRKKTVLQLPEHITPATVANVAAR